MAWDELGHHWQSRSVLPPDLATLDNSRKTCDPACVCCSLCDVVERVGYTPPIPKEALELQHLPLWLWGPTILRVASLTLKFSYDDREAMNLGTLNHTWLGSDDNPRAYGLLMCGAFNAFNTSRHARFSDGEQAGICITQHRKQGTFGHPPSMTFFDQRWQNPVSHIC
jgi:hypothetical protein